LGFGLLIFGYFAMFAFSISSYYFFADIIGSFIVIKAYSKLAQYNRYFNIAMLACLVFLVFCGVNAASLMFDIYDPQGNIAIVLDVLKSAASCVMHIYMFLGMRGIAGGADCTDIKKTVERNNVLTMIYYVLYAGVLILHPFFSENVQLVSVYVEIYWMICVVLNLVLMYRCFAVLYSADDDQSEKKRSRFAIINKMNDKFDELEIKRNDFTRESMKMAIDEADKRRSEKTKKKEKKKKKK